MFTLLYPFPCHSELVEGFFIVKLFTISLIVIVVQRFIHFSNYDLLVQ